VVGADTGPFRVSVVVPCYNHAETLERALQSVLDQTRAADEVLVIDDCSSDASLQVALAFSRRSGVPVRVTGCPVNRGPAAVRNVGWEQATGTHVAFLDADDAWHPRKLELQLQVFAQHPGLALCGHAFRVAAPGEEVPVLPDLAGGVPSEPLDAGALRWHNTLPTPSVMLRRDLPQRFREDQRLSEDYLLWCEIVFSGASARRLPLPLLTLFKSSFGEQGLSARLWPMERAELQVFRRLGRQRLLPWPAVALASVWSLVKFTRRLALVLVQGRTGRTQ